MNLLPAFKRVDDNEDTAPTDIMGVVTPPPSEKRPCSPEKSSEELRDCYQLKGKKTKNLAPKALGYVPYTPEVVDASARASTDPFTPDDKVSCGTVLSFSQFDL